MASPMTLELRNHKQSTFVSASVPTSGRLGKSKRIMKDKIIQNFIA